MWVALSVYKYRIDLSGKEKQLLRPSNGLEMSRPASPGLVSRQSQALGWPGRLHRVVRPPQGASFIGRGGR